MPNRSPRVVVTADDFGLTDGVCEAVFDAHEAGTISATSVLAVGPALERHGGRLAATEGLEAGLHVALVGEDPPMLTANEIPSLVDRGGRLSMSWRTLVARLAAGRVDPGDVERESRAQLERVRGLGIEVTHLNSHQHMHLWPSVGRVLTDLAISESIGVVRMPGGDRASARSALIAALARRGRGKLLAAGLACPDRVVGLADAGSMTGDHLSRALDRAGDADTTEVVLHPGCPDDPERDRYRWGYDWAGEWRALTDGTMLELITDRGLQLVPPSAMASQ